MPFTLPKLPYEQHALAPVMSKETLEYHYGKHHKTYVDNMNKQLEDSPLKDATLEEIVRKSSGGLFNNAAQAWNHTFYWYSLAANGESQMSSGLERALKDSFGSKEKFAEEFHAQGLANFGSGWTWLVRDKAGKLSVVNTSNADTPVAKGEVPILVVDVWEHAYYIDYRNARKDFLTNFQRIVNWKFVSERYDSGEIFSCTRLMRA